MKKLKWWLVGMVAVVIVGIAGTYLAGSTPIMVGAAVMNLFRSLGNPASDIQIEVRKAAQRTDAQAGGGAQPGSDSGEWVSYNRTVDSDRYSRLDQINAGNAGQLKVLCTYDTKRLEGSQTGLLMVGGALVGTTADDIFSIDANTCKENWRVHEDAGIPIFPVNRGATYLDGKLIRAFPDGYMRAYEAATGKKLWETFVGDKKAKLWFTAAPIAWNGMVFFGVAGGDSYGNRGRMFGLDAATGNAVWQVFTVPKQAEDTVVAPEAAMPTEQMKASWGNPPDVPVTGGGTWTSYSLDPQTGYLYIPVGNPAPDFIKTLRPGTNLFTNTMLVLNAKTGDYIKHYSIMADDWHDWDMSNPPVLYTSRGGRKQLSFHPKDGHIYTFSTADDKLLYRNPVTRIENANAPFEPGKDVHFCPGSVGGGEWNSAAYDPAFNLVFTGENDWCTTARIVPDSKGAREPVGGVWFGVAYFSPYRLAGKQDDKSTWGGWLYATDADTGEWAWRARTNYPIVAAVTPAAGNIVMFGDLGGNFYILGAGDGKQLWKHHFDGALAGGVITYAVNGVQRIALMEGVAHPQWPIEPDTGKIAIIGL